MDFLRWKHSLKAADVLFCVLCGSSLQRIHSLDCGHVFCGKCVDEGQITQHRCPTCSAVSRSQGSHLPDEHEARTMFKIIRAEEKKLVCDACKKKKADCYCADCTRRVCSACVAKQHKTHRTQLVKEYQLKCLDHKLKLEECTDCKRLLVKDGNWDEELAMRRELLSQQCKELENKVDLNAEWEQRLKGLREERERARMAAHRSIERHLEIATEKLRNQAKELKRSVEQEYKDAELKMKHMEEQTKRQTLWIKTLRTIVRKVLKQDVYLMANFHDVKDATQSITTEDEIDVRPLLKISTLKPNTKHTLGEMQASEIEAITRPAESTPLTCDAVETEKDLVLIRNIKHGEAKPTGLTFLTNGNLAVAYCEEKRIVTYDEFGQRIRTISARDDKFMPSGIASFKNDQIVACDADELQLKFFNINRSSQTPTRFAFKFHSPRDVSVNDRHIGVCDSHLERIVIFDYNGHVQCVIDDNFKHPTFIAFCGSQVWASNGDEVRVYDEEGRRLVAKERPSWQKPRDITQCSEGMVVVDSGEHSVVLCGEGIEVEFKVVRSPRIIAVNNNSEQKRLAVTSAEHGRFEGVYVYAMHM